MTKLYLSCFIILSLYACRSATKLYDRGNYEDAVSVATKKLQKDPYDQESVVVLKNAYRFAVNRHEEQIRNLSASAGDNRYERIANEYARLQSLYEVIHQSPAALTAVKPTDYSSYLQTYRDKAADVHFEKGRTLLEEAVTKASFREAYNEFRQAARFRSGDAAIQKNLQQAYDAAVVRVVIEPMDPYTMMYRSNTYQLRNFQEDVIRTLNFNSGSEFVKFYSSWDASSGRIQPDEILEFRLGRMDMGRPYDQTNSRQVSKDVVTKEIVYKPDSVVKQYTRVYAQVNTVQRTLVSTGELFVISRDNNGRVLWNDVFRGEHRWQTKFVNYTGDERALSESDRQSLTNRTLYTPTEEEVMRQVLQQIQNDIKDRLRNYFNRY